MAKAKKAEEGGEEGAGEGMTSQETKERRAPNGFRRRGAVAEAPWFHNEAGNVCHGKLLGRDVMNGVEPPRPYYQVEVMEPCTVTVGKGDEAEQVTSEVGDVVNVGETFKLECLKELEIPEILAGGAYDVWVNVEKKIRISGGRTMWVIDVQTKRTKNPTGEVRALPADSGKSADGEDSAF